MKERLIALADRYEAFSLRERTLIMAAIIVLTFMLWDTLLFTPEELRHKQIIAKIEGTNKQSETVNSQIQIMTESINGGKPEHVRSRLKELKSQLENLRKQQKDLTIEFIKPAQMSKVLHDMLAAENGLMLTRLESLGVMPLFPPPEKEKKPAKESNKNINNAGDQHAVSVHRPEIFKHGLRIVFEGDYFSTLHYLKNLESLPWRLYWDNVEYQVLDYPSARVAITVHTLSLNKGWIGV